MAHYTNTKNFQSTGATVVTVIPNAGTAVIKILVGTTYRDIQEITENTSVTVEGRGVEFQVAVTGDAEYEVI